MPDTDTPRAYIRLAKELVATSPTAEEGLQRAVGGAFDSIGPLERDILIRLGLRPQDYLIDVGCGIGRLANPLGDYLSGLYLGVDVVPDFIDYARRLVARPGWRFELGDGFTIPEEDGRADAVCFFSVFTHLLHERSYLYLQEARRVLKPGGMLVFSFLEFRVPLHWPAFEAALLGVKSDMPPNVFLSRDAIEAWSARLSLRVERVITGDSLLPYVYASGDGPESCRFGQSVCMLRKAPSPAQEGAAGV